MSKQVGEIAISGGIAHGIEKGKPRIAGAFNSALSGLTDFELPSIGGTTTTSTETNAPITLIQNFYGSGDQDVVRDAANLGILDAFRAVGVNG